MPKPLSHRTVNIRWAKATRLLAEGIEPSEVRKRVKLGPSTFYRRLALARAEYERSVERRAE